MRTSVFIETFFWVVFQELLLFVAINIFYFIPVMLTSHFDTCLCSYCIYCFYFIVLSFIYCSCFHTLGGLGSGFLRLIGKSKRIFFLFKVFLFQITPITLRHIFTTLSFSIFFPIPPCYNPTKAR